MQQRAWVWASALPGRLGQRPGYSLPGGLTCDHERAQGVGFLVSGDVDKADRWSLRWRITEDVPRFVAEMVGNDGAVLVGRGSLHDVGWVERDCPGTGSWIAFLDCLDQSHGW
jgi:hypothetical protein